MLLRSLRPNMSAAQPVADLDLADAAVGAEEVLGVVLAAAMLGGDVATSRRAALGHAALH